jgi:glutamine amidotransferase
VIGVVDYSGGNLASVGYALDHLGVEWRRVGKPEVLREADGLIFPGVGAAGPVMDRLVLAGLDLAIRAYIGEGRPYLGICLGMQLLFEVSAEDGASCLGVLGGRVVRIATRDKLPHVGWNTVEQSRSCPVLFDSGEHEDKSRSGESVVGRGSAGRVRTDTPREGERQSRIGTSFYFSHSYVVEPSAPITCGVTEYGGVHFTSAVCARSVLGVQFHPERSGAKGLALLERFAAAALVGRACLTPTPCDIAPPGVFDPTADSPAGLKCATGWS